MADENESLLKKPIASQSLASSIRDILVANESLGIQVSLNFARDLVWTVWSYLNLNTRVTNTYDASYDAEGQWWGQQVYSTLSMLLVYVSFTAIYKYNKRHFLYADAAIYLMAASVAIYTYDRGAEIGTNFGQNNLHMSPNQAAFFSSICTGTFEAFTQAFIIVMANLHKSAQRRRYFLNPLCFIYELMLANLSIAALPGAVWQLIFAAGVIGELGAPATAILVALNVAICNVISSKTVAYLSGKIEQAACFYPQIKPVKKTLSIQSDVIVPIS